MGLDKQTAELLEQLNQQAISADEKKVLDIASAREASRFIWHAFAGENNATCLTEDIYVDGVAGKIPVRIYRREDRDSNQSLPIVVFLHGGGWAMGDIDSYDGLMHTLCAMSGAIIVSVDYRLAPEHKYPAGLEDGLAVMHWVGENADSLGGNGSRLAIMGDSAGGNLTAVIAHRLHSEGNIKLAAQFLICPVLDVSNAHATYPSRVEFGSGDYMLTRESIDMTVEWYLDGTGEAADPEVSPLLANNLDILPPTTIIAAGHDPLVDEARYYADKLKEADVPTHFKCFNSTIHAFLSFGVLDVAREAREYLAEQIKQQLGSGNSQMKSY